MIRDSGEHLLGLVLDILDFAAINEKKLRLNPAPVALHALFDSVVQEFNLTHKNLQVTLSSTITTDCPPVLADRNRLYQIGLNLIDNALKFTERGHVTISAEVRDVFVAITVADSGIGIPPSQPR